MSSARSKTAGGSLGAHCVSRESLLSNLIVLWRFWCQFEGLVIELNPLSSKSAIERSKEHPPDGFVSVAS